MWLNSMKYEITSDLETGNARIDNQHRQLFKAVNDLLDACAQGKGRAQLQPVADFLTSYVDKHFKDEEQLQVQTSYPGYSAHRQFHEGYKRELNQVARELSAKGPDIVLLGKINQVVGTLVNHIRIEDKKVAQHVK